MLMIFLNLDLCSLSDALLNLQAGMYARIDYKALEL